MFVNKLFTYLTCAYLKIKSCFNVKFSTFYVHVKTNILPDFQICISVPLRQLDKSSISEELVEIYSPENTFVESFL